MRVRTALLPDHLSSSDLQGNTLAVVIDTLRFTSTACQALAVGGKRLFVVGEVEQARHLAAQATTKPLLCGERECVPIPGFDKGNSPLEYSAAEIADRDLVFTTTNGTRAVELAARAEQLWLASLVNRAAVAGAIRDLAPKEIWLVCSGTDGCIAMEDVLAAGALLQSLKPLAQIEEDGAWLAWSCWNSLPQDPGPQRTAALKELFQQARGGANLQEKGFGGDLDFCGQLDQLDVVPSRQAVQSDYGLEAFMPLT